MTPLVYQKYGHFRQQFRYWKRRISWFFVAVFFIWYVDCLPAVLFDDSTSTVLLDRNGQLLGAHISKDEQWRFPECDSVPHKFKTCIIAFEDRNFYSHFGVSAKGIVRAISQNMSSGKRVSGGSTLAMQLMRLIRKKTSKNLWRESVGDDLCYTTRVPFIEGGDSTFIRFSRAFR